MSVSEKHGPLFYWVFSRKSSETFGTQSRREFIRYTASKRKALNHIMMIRRQWEPRLIVGNPTKFMERSCLDEQNTRP